MSSVPLNVTLTDGQRTKLRSAFKQKNGVTIQLTYDQLRRAGGQDVIAVTQKQANEITKARTLGKGCRLSLSSNQLKDNYKGGFLPLVFAGLAALGSLLGGASAVANSVIDYKDRKNQLTEVIRHNKAMENKSGGRIVKPQNKTRTATSTKRRVTNKSGGVRVAKTRSTKIMKKKSFKH